MDRQSEVVGLPVICVENGRRIGTVEQVLFCPRLRTVKGFLLERKGGRIAKKVILLEDVSHVGRDAIIVKDYSCAKKLKEAEKKNGLKDRAVVNGLKVYTKTGDDLGIVRDVLFDHKTGTMEGVEVSDGLLEDILRGRYVLPLFGKVEFGEDSMLVDREAIEEMNRTGGGLGKYFL